MPSTRIEVKKGYSKDFLIKLMDITHYALVNILQIPIDDRNQRLMEFEPDFFYSKHPYEIFIEINMFKGRNAQLKELLFQEIVNKLNQELNIEKTQVFILIHDVEMDNWGIRGGLQASKIGLKFKT